MQNYHKKSQAALEFLTTYGWAFLVILIMISALAYFGILSPSKLLPDRCNFGAEFACTEFSLGANGLLLKLRNNLGNTIIIDSLSVSTEKKQLTCNSNAIGAVWKSGEVKNFPMGCSIASDIIPGDKGKLNLKISYHSAKSGALFKKDVQGEVYATASSQGVSFYENEGFAIKDQIGRVWWLKNNGGASFTQTRLSDAPTAVAGCLHGAIDVNDYNNDGLLDIAVGTRGTPANPVDIPATQVAYGKSDGTFKPWVEVARMPTSGGAACTMDYTSGDFNQDGNIDLIIAGDWQPPYFLRGNGDGTFGSPVPLEYQPGGGGQRGRDASDFNGDGKLDFAVGRCCDGVTYLYKGNGDGTFQPSTNIFTVGNDQYTLAAGDFDNDGKPDIVAGGSGGGQHYFLKGNGDVTFQAGVLVFTTPQYGAGDAFDFNHDGKLDMVVNSWGSVTTYYVKGNGDGTFQPLVQVGTTSGFDATMAIAAPPVYG